MEKKVIIYTGSFCTHCKIIKRFMDDNHIEYEERSIEDETNKNEILEKGFMSIPILVIDGEYHAVTSNNFIGFLTDIL